MRTYVHQNFFEDEESKLKKKLFLRKHNLTSLQQNQSFGTKLFALKIVISSQNIFWNKNNLSQGCPNKSVQVSWQVFWDAIHNVILKNSFGKNFERTFQARSNGIFCLGQLNFIPNKRTIKHVQKLQTKLVDHLIGTRYI